MAGILTVILRGAAGRRSVAQSNAGVVIAQSAGAMLVQGNAQENGRSGNFPSRGYWMELDPDNRGFLQQSDAVVAADTAASSASAWRRV
jgi:hypothetical protein